MSEKTAHRHLPTLVKAGFVKVVQADTSKTPKHYGVTAKMHLDREGMTLFALFCPAWLDDGALPPDAFRLYYHYLSCSYDGEVKVNHARAARVCFSSEKSTLRVRNAETKLLHAGFVRIKQQGKHDIFTVRQRETEKLELGRSEIETIKPPICDTPTVEQAHPYRPLVTPLPPTCDTPNRPLVTPKGLLKGSKESSKHDNKKALKSKPQNDFFEVLLNNDYSYFGQFITQKLGDAETVLTGWLEMWGAERITEVWTYLSENTTPWHEKEKHGNKRLARLYGLFDTMRGDFKNGQPQRLCALWVEVVQELTAKRQAAIPQFERYDVVCVAGERGEYRVTHSSGIQTFFEDDYGVGGRAYASSYDCTFIRHEPPEKPTELYESPRVRRRREARERRHPDARQSLGATQWTR